MSETDFSQESGHREMTMLFCTCGCTRSTVLAPTFCKLFLSTLLEIWYCVIFLSASYLFACMCFLVMSRRLTYFTGVKVNTFIISTHHCVHSTCTTYSDCKIHYIIVKICTRYNTYNALYRVQSTHRHQTQSNEPQRTIVPFPRTPEQR